MVPDCGVRLVKHGVSLGETVRVQIEWDGWIDWFIDGDRMEKWLAEGLVFKPSCVFARLLTASVVHSPQHTQTTLLEKKQLRRHSFYIKNLFSSFSTSR